MQNKQQQKTRNTEKITSILLLQYLTPVVNRTRQMHVNSRIQNSHFWNPEYWIKSLLSAFRGISLNQNYSWFSTLLAYLQVFPLLSTALWHYQTLFNILLSGNILLNHGLSLPSAGVQLAWAGLLPPEGSLEDSADPQEGHTWHQQAEVLTLSDWRRTDVEIAHTRINTSHRLPHGKKQTNTEQPSFQIQWNTDI